MTGQASAIDIPQMASVLNGRREKRVATALLLGARAGKLFHNLHFYNTLKPFSQSPFDALSAKDKFQECYRILSRAAIERNNDVHQLLVRALQDVQIEASDLVLAELVELGVFNPLITTNIDAGLEQALLQVGLRQAGDFHIFRPGSNYASLEPGIWIVKVFGSVKDRDYVIDRRLQHLESHDALHEVIKATHKRDILMIGVDPVWDEGLLAAIFPRDGTALWYIGDEHPPQDSPIFSLLDQNKARVFVGKEGAYESFFKSLHWHITHDIPVYYTMLVVAGLRQHELQLVGKALETIRSHVQPILRSSFFADFFGIDGLGKTSLLQQIKQLCDTRGFACLLVDASQSFPTFLRDVLEQVQKYRTSTQPAFQLIEQELYAQSVKALKDVLEIKPLVILLDAVEEQNAEQFSHLAKLLEELSGHFNLFVVLTSKQRITFGRNRALGRKLSHFALKPFDRAGSGAYLNRIGRDLDPEIKKTIFEWTQGYPLALTVMTQAIIGEQLDPRLPEHQSKLLAIIMRLVIDDRVLASVEEDRLEWYRTHISLLSLPRRFNITLLRELIEAFASSLAPQNIMEYIGHIKLIQQKTDVLFWDSQRMGYTLAATIRNLFFRYWQMEHPERFYKIHTFLAENNRQTALQTRGSGGSVQSWREYLYHSAYCIDSSGLPALCQQVVQSIRQEAPDAITQFAEEVEQDDELREALGNHFGYLSRLIKDTFNGG